MDQADSAGISRHGPSSCMEAWMALSGASVPTRFRSRIGGETVLERSIRDAREARPGGNRFTQQAAKELGERALAGGDRGGAVVPREPAGLT